VTAHLTLRERVVRGTRGQLVSHAARVLAQVASVSVLIASWGLHRYGDWVILSAIPTYLAFSDIGFTGAATNEMTMAAGRGDHDRARSVFQAVSAALLGVLAVLAVALPLVALTVPLGQVLNLSTLSESSAAWTFVVLGFDTLFTVYAGLLYGAFASGGHYGDGAMLMALTMLGEFGALALIALAGGGPPLGAVGMLIVQVTGTIVMYAAMRRRVPWLRLGRPPKLRTTLRPLLSPALAAGALPGALTVNMQGMILVIGIAVGPAGAAVFSTLRTMSRAVIQLVSSVQSVVIPEIARAFAADEGNLLRALHRRGCQIAFWLSLSMVAGLALFGGSVLHVWTSGKVGKSGPLLYLFLIATVVDSLWYTSLAVLYATNRHQRVAGYYMLASVLSLPLAYGLLQVWGLSGAGTALLVAEVFMLFPVLHQSLPAAQDRPRAWLGAVARPPLTPAMLAQLRAGAAHR
jgi:O-antigen/teichoic acid export membrane protein